MLKPKYSKKDYDGTLQVDCSECRRGGNGENNEDTKCSTGWNIKKGRRGSCCNGELIEGYDMDDPGPPK